MSKNLYITEKPSVAREFAKALKERFKNFDGYMESDDSIVTWCVGHLVTMSYPDKYDEALEKWELDSLPFLPQTFKYEIIKDVSKQFKTIKTLLNRTDVSVIYNCGDSGREGEYIQRLVLQEAKYNPKAQIKRVWIDSQTEQAILAGIHNAKDSYHYDNLSSAAYERAKEDYLMGINFSRALSVKYAPILNSMAKTGSYIPVSVGRVMTCVLGMIVNREREIENFTETPYYGIVARCEKGNIPIEAEWKATENSAYYQSSLLYNDKGFKDKETAEKLVKEFDNKGKLFISKINQKTETKHAPLLFNLAELQAECSKLYKISPAETLAIAQSLYEYKLTTYPRTDARVLSTAIAAVVKHNISGLEKVTCVSEYASEILTENWYSNIAKTRYTDDSKITDHYAIIPTGEGLENIGKLTDIEMKVYELISRRFLSVFYPAAEYGKTEVIFNINNESFFTSGTCIRKEGFLKVTGYNPDSNKKQLVATLNSLTTGVSLSADFDLKESKTTPPKRYSSGSIVLAMENAGNLIEDDELRMQIKGSGIGTSATRAEIIEKLVKNDYIKLNKKTQILTPTEIGEMIYEIVHLTIDGLLNPKLTASWEKGLAEIEDGTLTEKEYHDKLELYIKKVIDELKNNPPSTQINKVLGDIHLKYGGSVASELKCPACGGELKKMPWGYGCSNYKTGCKFSVGEIFGKKLTAAQVESLILKKKTPMIHGFKSKAGKTFDAILTLDENFKVVPLFEKDDDNEKELLCPLCGKPFKKTTWSYECENSHKISRSIAGVKLSNSDIEDLITKGKTRKINGFESKAGKKFSAKIVFKNGKTEFSFE